MCSEVIDTIRFRAGRFDNAEDLGDTGRTRHFYVINAGLNNVSVSIDPQYKQELPMIHNNGEVL